MRVLLAHNDYARPSGEEHACEGLAALLQSRGHEVIWFRRSSAEIAGSAAGQAKAFVAGIHNPFAARALARLLDEVKPDLVQVQNLYPLLSPSVLAPCVARRIPVAMRCPNYRLFCPNGLHLCRDQVCERCLGPGRELHCVFRNCEGSLPKSLGYALRNAAARVFGRIIPRVDAFIVQSEFQKAKFVANGIPADRIGIVPGLLNDPAAEPAVEVGDTVSFVGRVSPEKGIREFLAAARQLPTVPFAVAGDTGGMPGIERDAPPNVTWHGFLRGEDLDRFYAESRIVVLPSLCHEGFPNVLTKAMAAGIPVVATRMGSMPEVVDDGVTGLLCEPGDATDLAARIGALYSRADLCRQYGEAGRRKALARYSPNAVYAALMETYEMARAHSEARPFVVGRSVARTDGTAPIRSR